MIEKRSWEPENTKPLSPEELRAQSTKAIKTHVPNITNSKGLQPFKTIVQEHPFYNEGGKLTKEGEELLAFINDREQTLLAEKQALENKKKE